MAKVADGFDFPVGQRVDGRILATPAAEKVDGFADGVKLDQGFGEKYAGKYHLGEDWNGSKGEDSDIGLAVYAIANGKVKFAGDPKDDGIGGWGNLDVVIVEHELASGEYGGAVTSLYGHVQNVSVSEGEDVLRGQKIAEIGNFVADKGKNDQFAHLHFEVRDDEDIGVGVGYSRTTKQSGYLNPSAFITGDWDVASDGNLAPVASSNPIEPVRPGTVIPLARLFSFSDPDGNDQIKSFYVTDVGNKGGYLTKAGLAQGQGAKVGSQPIDDIDQWAFVAGPDGSSDDVRFTVEDAYGAYNKKAAVATVHAVDEPQDPGPIIVQPGPEEGIDAFVTSVFGSPEYYEEYSGLIRVGGWGDDYYGLIKFDLTGLPEKADAAVIRLLAVDSSDVPVAMHLDRVDSVWDESVTWATKPGFTPLSQVPAPDPGSWYDVDVTSLYNAWQSNELDNHGIQLRPQSNWNVWSTFYSSDSDAGPAVYPQLVIDPADESLLI